MSKIQPERREVVVNMLLGKNEVTPWRDNPVAYISYPVCTTLGFSPKTDVRFKEILPDEIIVSRDDLKAAFAKAIGVSDAGGWKTGIHILQHLGFNPSETA